VSHALGGRDKPRGDRRLRLQDATLEGVRWITYGRVATELISFATLAILAHLIPPVEYGRVAIALILQGLAFALTNEGFGNPLVQRRELDGRHVGSATVMSLAFGALLCALVLVVAPLVATPLYGPRTTQLVQLASALFPIYSLVVVPEALLMRQLQLARITLAEITGLLAGSTLSVALAIVGLGATAVVIGTIATAAVTALVLLAHTGLPRVSWRWHEARDVLAYGLPAALAALLYLAVRNVDNVLVGARLGARRLGLYYRAFALGVANQQKIGLILMRVAFPAYSGADGGEQMRRMRNRMTCLNSAVILPLLVLLAITAPEVVPFVFGARWAPAVVPTQILTAAGIASSLTGAAFPFLFAAGHPRAVLRLNAATLVVFLGALLLALPHGLRAVCLAVVATNIFTMLAAYWLMRRLAAVPLSSAWRDTAPALAGSVVLGAITLPLLHLLSAQAALPPIAAAALAGCAGGAGYLLTLRGLFRDAFDDLALVARRVAGRGGATVPAAG